PACPYNERIQAMQNYYVSTTHLPSFGTIHQVIKGSLGKKGSVALNILADIKTTDIANSVDILKKFEAFIKDSMSVEFFNEFGEKYKSGDRDGARSLLLSTSS